MKAQPFSHQRQKTEMDGEGKGEMECGIFPLQSQEGHSSVVSVSYRQNLSEDRNKFLRFPPSIVSYFPRREMELGYFPLEVCGFLKRPLKFKIDLMQSEKEVTYTISFNMTNSTDSFSQLIAASVSFMTNSVA